MTSRLPWLTAVCLALFAGPHTARAEMLGGGDSPVLRCTIAQCSPADQCHEPFQLGSAAFNADVGGNFLFQVSDDWAVTPGHFTLEDRRFTGASYLTRTVVNMDVNRATKALELTIALDGTGITPRQVAATGNCETVNTVAVPF